MAYLKWDANFNNHPQVSIMDWRGKVYFWQLCSICKLNTFRGTIPKRHASPSYVASQLGGIPIDDMAAGMDQSIEAELVEILDDGSVFIPGWRNWQVDPTGSARAKRWRERQKSESNGNNESNALRNGVTRTTVTRNAILETRLEGEGEGEGEGKKEGKDPNGSSCQSEPKKPITVASLREGGAYHSMLSGDSKRSRAARHFMTWASELGKNGNAQLTPATERALKAAMTHSTDDEIEAAIHACAGSEFHVSSGFTGIGKYIVKDRDKIEWWLERARQKKRNPTKTADVDMAQFSEGDRWEFPFDPPRPWSVDFETKRLFR